jgi:hypothetical protein
VGIPATSGTLVGAQCRCAVACNLVWSQGMEPTHQGSLRSFPLRQCARLAPGLPCAIGDPSRPTNTDADGASRSLHRLPIWSRAEVVYVCARPDRVGMYWVLAIESAIALECVPASSASSTTVSR